MLKYMIQLSYDQRNMHGKGQSFHLRKDIKNRWYGMLRMEPNTRNSVVHLSADNQVRAVRPYFVASKLQTSLQIDVLRGLRNTREISERPRWPIADFNRQSHFSNLC